jgi:hypothetical protein
MEEAQVDGDSLALDERLDIGLFLDLGEKVL